MLQFTNGGDDCWAGGGDNKEGECLTFTQGVVSDLFYTNGVVNVKATLATML